MANSRVPARTGHSTRGGASLAALGEAVPMLLQQAGGSAAYHAVEFFAARISNPNTRATYARAIGDFCRWCAASGIAFSALSSLVVASYFAALRERLSPASANVQLSAIRQWLEWLTARGILPFNPAACVRGVRLARTEGKTPVLDRDQARRLFASFDAVADIVSLRDRAILAVMLYGFVRVGAVVRMRVRDFQNDGGDAWLVLHEKGGKQRRLPVAPPGPRVCRCLSGVRTAER
jgi:site-specific recombinase XerD